MLLNMYECICVASYCTKMHMHIMHILAKQAYAKRYSMYILTDTNDACNRVALQSKVYIHMYMLMDIWHVNLLANR